MTTIELATALLAHFSPDERSIPDAGAYPGRNSAVLQAINGGLQELFGNASPWVRYDERGTVLNAPVTVPIAVVAGSTAAEIAEDDWEEWFAGCTIVINGSAVDNQIRNNKRLVRLKFPHDGDTGSTTATIYHDSVTIGDDVQEVVGPVNANRMPVVPVPNVENASKPIPAEDFGFHLSAPEAGALPPRVAESTGRPLVYAVESWSPDAMSPPETRMRLRPAPAAKTFLEWRVMLAAPVLTTINTTNALPIPLNYVASILLPVARQRLTACPYFRDVTGVEEIGRSYREAMNLLQSLNPRKSTGMRILPIH